MTEKVKILFFASNPDNTAQLHLDEEIRSITMQIRASEYRDNLDLVSAWATRPDDLLQELNTHKPTIVHFSGHGNGGGGLILMNNYRQAQTVSAPALRALFATLKGNIRLVVLNACYTRPQAKAISNEIDCVVGMDDAIGDQAAITFASSFYRAIGFGVSVKQACDQGIVSLMLEGIREEKKPKLLARKGVDPAVVWPLKVEPSQSPTIRVNQEVAKEIYELAPVFETQRIERKKGIAEFYRKVAATLMEVATSLRANIYPHGNCEKMLLYAEQLPETIGDIVGGAKAYELSQKLRESYRVEGLFSELNYIPDREGQLINLDRAAAYFDASADMLLVSR